MACMWLTSLNTTFLFSDAATLITSLRVSIEVCERTSIYCVVYCRAHVCARLNCSSLLCVTILQQKNSVQPCVCLLICHPAHEHLAIEFRLHTFANLLRTPSAPNEHLERVMRTRITVRYTNHIWNCFLLNIVTQHTRTQGVMENPSCPSTPPETISALLWTTVAVFGIVYALLGKFRGGDSNSGYANPIMP